MVYVGFKFNESVLVNYRGVSCLKSLRISGNIEGVPLTLGLPLQLIQVEALSKYSVETQPTITRYNDTSGHQFSSFQFFHPYASILPKVKHQFMKIMEQHGTRIGSINQFPSVNSKVHGKCLFRRLPSIGG